MWLWGGNKLKTKSIWLACTGLAATSFAAGLVAVPGVAAAQQPARTGYQIEEVVVTARKIEENIQQVPIAVSAFSDKRLKELVVNSTQDLNKLSPSLQASSCSGNRNACFQPTIRGQGTTSMTQQSSVALYFADVPNFPVAYYDLQSVQVLKGPQGTLFGETATGGAILFTPKKPGNEIEAYARIQLGNLNYKGGEAAVGGAIIEDRLMVRLAGQFRIRDGFTKGYASFSGPRGLSDPVDFDNVDTADWRASVVFKPFDNFENYTVYSALRSKLNGTGQGVLYANQFFLSAANRDLIPANNPTLAAHWLALTGQPAPAGLSWGQIVEDRLARQVALGPRAILYNYDRHSEVRSHGLANQTRWDISDNLSIKNIFGLYWQRGRGALIDTDGTDIPAIDTGAVKNPDGSSAWTGGWPARNWSNELQLIGKAFGGRLDWQAGLFYKRQPNQREFGGPTTIVSLASTVSQGLPTAAATCTNVYRIPAGTPCVVVNRNLGFAQAAYAQGTFEVLENVHFTAGYRRSQEWRQAQTTVQPVTFATVNGIQVAIAQRNEPFANAPITEVTVPKASFNNYTLSLDWQITPDNLVYVTSRKGYKGGGINNNTPIDSPLRKFGPETLTDAEIGFKSDWTIGGMRGRTNVAAYKAWYKDIQRSSGIAGQALTVTGNLADGVIQGIEFETTIFPTDWFELAGFFALTDATYDEWTERVTCAAQFYRPQCHVGGVITAALLPAGTEAIIDHVKGTIVVVGPNNGPQIGTTTNFRPDYFKETSKWRFGIQPKLRLEGWTGEDITLGMNIYYRSKGQWGTADSNTSLTAGNEVPKQTVFGLLSVPNVMAGYTLADFRADWRSINGSKVSAAVSVTNLFDKTVNTGGSGGLTIAGITPFIANEPRMWFMEVSYEF